MVKIAKERKALMWTIFLLSSIQIPHYALTAGIDLLHTTIFPQYSLSDIQTVIFLPSLLAAACGVVSSLLIRYRRMGKRTAVLIGLILLVITGFAAVLFHTMFAEVIIFSIFIGAGMGFYIPTTVSIMFDSFEEKERQFISGTSISFVTAGCILMSIIGGWLTTRVWYGGYFVLLLAIPILILAVLSVPKEQPLQQTHEKKMITKLHRDVYYFSFLAFLYMLIYTVATSNISSHLAAASLGNAATAGIATAVMMAGGIAAGLVFHNLSAVFKDHMFALSFALMFLGYSMMNLLQNSLTAVFIAVFIIGTSVSVLIPQCMYDISNIVDETNSATSTMLFSSLAPGIAGFLSSMIFTNLSTALGSNSTAFRFQIAGLFSLGVAVLVFLNTLRRGRKAKEKEGPPE